MSDLSANLSLPYLLPSQAQKHVTHNEALRLLDVLVQLSVLSVAETAPPAVPEEGDRYLLPLGVTGDWAGQAGKLAAFDGASWAFITPQAGWIAWVADSNAAAVFDGTQWMPILGGDALQNLDMVGIATTADAVNRLAVASEAALFTHAGAGHQIKVNKAAAGDTASLLFQTAWSGRAEMGTAGSDSFQIKVSPDGTTFHQALVADPATGIVDFPAGATGLAPDDFGTGPLTTSTYVAARGADLVTNGTGLLGNGYNMPPVFSFDPLIAPNLPGSFSYAGYNSGVVVSGELIPVDPNQVYRLQAYVRQEGLAGDWSAYVNEERQAHYMGVACYDSDGNLIASINHMRYKHNGIDSMTTLAAPLTPGDTLVSLTDASGWNELHTSAEKRGIILFGYKSGAGQLYTHYSRYIEQGLFDLGQVNKVTHEVTLNQGFPTSMGNPDDPNGTWPAGTPIANSSIDTIYKYALLDNQVLDEVDRWFRVRNHFGGMDLSGNNAEANFPPGTAFVRLFWMANYSNRSGGFGIYPDTGAAHRVWFAGISVTPEPLAAMQAVTTGTDAGSQALKVPQSDFGTGAIGLVTPTATLTAL